MSSGRLISPAKQQLRARKLPELDSLPMRGSSVRSRWPSLLFMEKTMKTLLAILVSPVILGFELILMLSGLAFFLATLSISPKTMWWFWPLMIGLGCLADKVLS